ncbi:MAG: hypothetical protein ACLFU8_06180 [Anaerolineales bacterium]
MKKKIIVKLGDIAESALVAPGRASSLDALASTKQKPALNFRAAYNLLEVRQHLEVYDQMRREALEEVLPEGQQRLTVDVFGDPESEEAQDAFEEARKAFNARMEEILEVEVELEIYPLDPEQVEGLGVIDVARLMYMFEVSEE